MAKALRPTDKPERSSVFPLKLYPRPKIGCSDDDFLRALKDVAGNSMDWENASKMLLLQVVPHLNPYAFEDDRGNAMLNMGNGWKRYQVPENAPDETWDAVQAMDNLYILHRLFSSKKPAKLQRLAIDCAFNLGILQTLMHHIRPNERYTVHGLKIRQKGGQQPVLTDDEIDRVKKDYIRIRPLVGSNNAAVDRVLNSLNDGRRKPVGKTTIQRVVGVRKRTSTKKS